MIIGVIVPIVLLSAIGGIIIFVVVIRKLKKEEEINLNNLEPDDKQRDIERKTVESISAIFGGSAKVVKYSDIKKENILGKGSFGIVHKWVYVVFYP